MMVNVLNYDSCIVFQSAQNVLTALYTRTDFNLADLIFLTVLQSQQIFGFSKHLSYKLIYLDGSAVFFFFTKSRLCKTRAKNVWLFVLSALLQD